MSIGRDDLVYLPFLKYRRKQLSDNIDIIVDDVAATHKVITKTNVTLTKLSQCTENIFSRTQACFLSFSIIFSSHCLNSILSTYKLPSNFIKLFGSSEDAFQFFFFFFSEYDSTKLFSSLNESLDHREVLLFFLPALLLVKKIVLRVRRKSRNDRYLSIEYRMRTANLVPG